MAQQEFEVLARREGRWWVFEIPELGAAGEVRDLADVEREAVGVIATWLNLDPETVAVHVIVKG